MRIVVITKRKAERDRLRQEQLVQQALKQLEDADAAWKRAWLPILERNARYNRLMSAIWVAHDAGQLPYELDSLLLNEWADDRPAAS